MLKITKENLAKSKVKLTVVLPPELMGGYFAKAYNKLAVNVEVKGFRPGKAPKHLTMNQIGENKIVSEIIDLALQDTYPQALKQENLIPVCPPKIEISKMADLLADNAQLEYVAEVELLPEVKLGDYTKIRIKKQEASIKVGKDELDQVLSHLQRQHAEFKDIDGPAKKDDRVELDFEGKERGVVLENLSSKNYPVILGSKVLMPEFEEKLIGLKKGDEKKFKLKIKEKEVDFEVKIHFVQEVILPKLDDELAKKFGQQNIDELKKVIKADILNQKKQKEKQNEENQVVEELLKIAEVEIPESLQNQEVERMVEQLKGRTAEMGLTFEKYLENLPGSQPGTRKTEEELRKDFAIQAEKTVKTGLILGEVGKKEKIDLSKEDSGHKVMERLLEIAKK